MVDCSGVISVWKWPALVVRYRNKREGVEPEIKSPVIGQILSTMKRGDGLICHASKHGEMKVIDMKMKYVELAGVLLHPVKHQHIIWNNIFDGLVQT